MSTRFFKLHGFFCRTSFNSATKASIQRLLLDLLSFIANFKKFDVKPLQDESDDSDFGARFETFLYTTEASCRLSSKSFYFSAVWIMDLLLICTVIYNSYFCLLSWYKYSFKYNFTSKGKCRHLENLHWSILEPRLHSIISKLSDCIH